VRYVAPSRLPRARFLALLALTLIALALPVLLPGLSRASDAVEELRMYLRYSFKVDAAELKEREKQLKQYTGALKSITELRQALSLPGWQDQTTGFGNLLPDRAARAEIGRRLETALTEAARKGDVPRRLAVAHAVGAMGDDIPPINPPSAKGDEGPLSTVRASRGYASSLAPILIRLCQDPEPAVRTAAARALGRINPERGPAVAALKGILARDEVGPRRAAAEALCGLVEIPTRAAPAAPEAFFPATGFEKMGGGKGFGKGGKGAKKAKGGMAAPAKGGFGGKGFGKGGGGFDPDFGPGGWGGRGSAVRSRARLREVLEAGADVIPVAAAGLADADPQVRTLCLEAFRRTAVALRDEGIVSSNTFLPGGTALTRLQQARLETSLKAIEEEKKRLRPVLGALFEHGASLRRGLRVPDAAVNQRSAEVVQILAQARAALRRGAAGLPPEAAAKAHEDPLGPVVLFAVPDLAAKLTHQDAAVRLACVRALSALDTDAAPAAEALVGALKDDDTAVRGWAVLALGGIERGALTEAVAAKVAVGLAGRAEDTNETVRANALVVVRRYGAAAAPAAASLTRALHARDARTQLLAIQALDAIGAKAKAAVPGLTAALASPETEVRIAAAQALGRFGRDAADATKALVAALDDANVAVRQAASEALLAIGE
jgi:HEAT repeat protein